LIEVSSSHRHSTIAGSNHLGNTRRESDYFHIMFPTILWPQVIEKTNEEISAAKSWFQNESRRIPEVFGNQVDDDTGKGTSWCCRLLVCS